MPLLGPDGRPVPAAPTAYPIGDVVVSFAGTPKELVQAGFTPVTDSAGRAGYNAVGMVAGLWACTSQMLTELTTRLLQLEELVQHQAARISALEAEAGAKISN